MAGEISKMFGNGEGGYVFISHSHQDIKKVREIRNALEKQGFEPLCFYLKCLTDDDEVEGLIKREIDAREVFVYLDSENARNSKWVQKEREYIQSVGSKTVRVIDLDKYDADDISRRIMDSMRVFLSYSHQDENLISKFRDKLIERNLKVFSDNSAIIGLDWRENILKQLEVAADHGCVIVFISKNSINSSFVQAELEMAVQLNACIIPVFIDISPEELPEMYKFYLLNIQCIFVEEDRMEEDINRVVKLVEDILNYKFNQ